MTCENRSKGPRYIKPGQHFNGLTPAEAERLDMLAEECAEVIQAISKIKRHGYDSHHPMDPEGPDNRERLVQEVGDVMTIINLMDGINDDLNGLSSIDIQEVLDRKMRYTHHQGDEK